MCVGPSSSIPFSVVSNVRWLFDGGVVVPLWKDASSSLSFLLNMPMLATAGLWPTRRSLGFGLWDGRETWEKDRKVVRRGMEVLHWGLYKLLKRIYYFSWLISSSRRRPATEVISSQGQRHDPPECNQTENPSTRPMIDLFIGRAHFR